MSLFEIKTHTIPASHFREFPRGTIPAAETPPALKLAVNQYTPRTPSEPSPGDLTIIFCHANGFHKELYEPLFDDLLEEYQKSGLKIKSIWAPDAVHQGASSVINDAVLGDDPSWNDLARDLLHMVNLFSAEMRHPIIGMGHSYGAHAIAKTSLMHPSLFTALVLIDPVIEDYTTYPSGQNPARASAKRRDIWPSLAEAEKYLRSREFYKSWDPRVLNLHIKHGFTPLPTHIYPNGTGVTLTTSKHQEVYTYLRPTSSSPTGFGRPEPGATYNQLHLLNPPVLYVVGAKSEISLPSVNRRKMERTPKAEMESVEETGHLLPLEKPRKVVEKVVPYLCRVVKRWGKEAEDDERTVRIRRIGDEFIQRLEKL